MDKSFYPIIQPQISSKKILNNFEIKTVTNSSKIIKNLINNKKNNNSHIESRAGVYEILSLVSNKKDLGETSCSINKRIYSDGDIIIIIIIRFLV